MIAIPNSGSSRRKAERGFLLVGVAVFIVVLTILAVSLFGLSGFESQFMIQSMRRDQAFSLAAGGIERARFALMMTDTLDSVKRFLPRDGVVYAVAMQGPLAEDAFADDSVGQINPSRDVWIRVVAQSGDSRVRMHARFTPGKSNEYYKRLITAQFVRVNLPSSLKPTHWQQTYLSGAVGEPAGMSDTSWNDPPNAPNSDRVPIPTGRPPIVQIPNMPVPDVVSYINAHRPTAPNIPGSPGGGNPYVLDATGDARGYRFFKSPQSGDAAGWNVIDGNSPCQIRVGGVAIWLLDKGIHFNTKVKITQIAGAAPGRLIIVSHKLASGPGIEFDYGIEDPPLVPGVPGAPGSGVPLILVTDGIVQIGNVLYTNNVDTMVGFLSIYADWAVITGPTAGHEMHLWHLPSMTTGTADPIIDELYNLDILPSTSAGANARLLLVPGTWQDLSAGIVP